MIREDSGKYYYRSNAADGEQLWFDFTLEIGDTIYLKHCYQDIFPEITSPEQLTVLNIEPTTLDNGSSRRKWTLQYSDNLSGMYMMTEEWIEGIGNANLGWEQPLAQTCIDSGINLRCYYENGYWVDAFGAFDGAISDTNCCDLVGLHEINQSNLILFPNPSSKELTIQSAAAISMVTITDETGRIVFTVQPNSMAIQVDIEALSSGYYFVFVKTENGRIEPMKFMKDL